VFAVAAYMDSKFILSRMSCSSKRLPTSRHDQQPTAQRASATPIANDKQCRQSHSLTRDASTVYLFKLQVTFCGRKFLQVHKPVL